MKSDGEPVRNRPPTAGLVTTNSSTSFSYLITAGTFGGARVVADRETSIAAGALTGLVAGVAKELYDKKAKRSASFKDLTWDLFGVAAGVFVAKQTR